MVLELKKSIADGKVLFGIRETVKHAKKISKAVVASDCRQEVISQLQNNKIELEVLEDTKHELANNLELDFRCEVFGLRK